MSIPPIQAIQSLVKNSIFYNITPPKNAEYIKFIEVAFRVDAQKLCPWAKIIIKICGGYLCFKSDKDFQSWKHLK